MRLRAILINGEIIIRANTAALLNLSKKMKEKTTMTKIKITAIRQTIYNDLMEQYENPIEHTCDVSMGQVWIADGLVKPDNFCQSAWDSISPFVKELSLGGGNFFDGWMKNPKSAMISCNDGFRPVSFYVEVIE